MISASTPFPPNPAADDAVAAVRDGAPLVGLSLQDMLCARLPRAIVTQAILAGIVAVYIAMVASSGEFAFSLGTMDRWGAQFAPAIVNGQWWRLLTAMWLHANPLHLGLNALFLWRFGNYVERLLGPVVFLIVYLLAGVIASVASLQVQGSGGLSVGASGALFGLVGVLLMVAMTSRGSGVLGDMLAELRPNLISVVGTNLMLGFLVPGIDNAAHIGGLVGGLVLGWFVGRHSLDALPSPRLTLIPIVMTAGIVAASVTAVGGRQDVLSEVFRVGRHAEDAEAAFRAARTDIGAGRRTAADVAADAERTQLPFVHDAQARADRIVAARSVPADQGRRRRDSRTPGDAAPPDVRIVPTLENMWKLCLAEYEYGWRLRVEGLRAGDARRIADGDERAAAAIRLMRKLGPAG